MIREGFFPEAIEKFKKFFTEFKNLLITNLEVKK